jgi:GGDEF domain-containing protein
VELTAPIVVRGHEVRSSVSLGIALASAGYERPEDMLRDADTAMYRAKADGRARHQVAGGAAVDITPSIRDVKAAT